MPSLINVCTEKTLAIHQSTTTLGSRQPVFGATLYNQHLGFSTETEVFNTQNCQVQSYKELEMDEKHSTIQIKDQKSHQE